MGERRAEAGFIMRLWRESEEEHVSEKTRELIEAYTKCVISTCGRIQILSWYFHENDAYFKNISLRIF